MRKALTNPDEFGFVWVLIAAVILILAFSVLGGLPAVSGPQNGTVLAEFALGTVGSETAASRAYSLGTFTVGEDQREVVKTIPQVSLGATLFSAEELETSVTFPDWLLEDLRDASLSFGVLETNNYGDLVVQWNGKELYRGRAGLGPVRLVIPRENVRGSNTLKISATGPAWRFWASTVYVLGNVQVAGRYGPAKLYGFELSNAELQGFDRGELTFFAAGNGSQLLVLVNGRQIFAKKPAGSETIAFSITDAPLRAGTNVLTLSVPLGTFTLLNANLRIFAFGAGISRSRAFNLTQEQMNLLSAGRGAIRYELLAINRPGALTWTLNGRELPASRPALGGNVVFFAAADAKAGENVLEARGTGSYEIGAVKVVAER